MLYIVPSRGRPGNIVSLIGAWETTRTRAELFVAIDHDDPALDEYMKVLKTAPPWCKWGRVRRERRGMVGALNYFANQFSKIDLGYAALGFMGDDHAPRTFAWDAMLMDALRLMPGVAYGNDLIQGANLPTAVAMSTQIVRATGRMAPMTLKHLYVDNYWKSLGERIGRLTYLPNCVIEHMHPIAGKALWDSGYEEVNAGSMYEHDQRAYAKFVAEGGLERDVAAIRRHI